MHFMEGLPRLLQYCNGGGGSFQILQYYIRGGVSLDPKFVLRNKWTAPYTQIRGRGEGGLNGLNRVKDYCMRAFI